MSILKQSNIAAALLLSATALANPTLITSNDHDREALSITIYNESLALINETRTMPLQAGANTIELKDVSAQIRAETALLTSLSNSPFKIIEQNFNYDLLSPHALLEKAVGEEIEVIKRNPKTGEETRETAKLLSNNGQPVLQFKDRIEIGQFDNFAFKSIPNDLRDRPTLSVLLHSEQATQNKVQLAYLTGGFSWKADYTATLSPNEDFMDIAGLITLRNQSGTTFNNAKLQLVAGDVNQVRENFGGRQMYKTMAMAVAYEAAEMDTTSEAFGDYHLYKIPFATDLKNNQTKQVALLSAQKVPVQKEYRFNQYITYTTPDGEHLKASVIYRMQNSKENALGMPLPRGIFRIYKNDSSNNALFIGEDAIQHTAENENFIVRTGEAFDVSLIKTLVKQQVISKDVTQYTYDVVFNNAKEENVNVEYASYIPGSTWQVLKSSHKTSPYNADTALWKVTVPAKEKVTLTYTMQISNI